MCYRPLAACETALRVAALLLLAWVMSEEPSVPTHIVHALRLGGDVEAVCQWLASEDGEEVLTSAMAEAAISHEYTTEAKLRFVQLALHQVAHDVHHRDVHTARGHARSGFQAQ